ncbi:CaiB/BaiF CoA-transferase family protein [Ramlibacter solisilvae]|uniref:CoA-transferase n=1 Tax=Ramlibacter tataouinensis TaxID=94132 RepID=A0A127JY87_9BURK|nr:CaiB/BaiF CoA-transferase family protein [Ramlibacter tataouinensis]AMO24950.1 CoA-transferase [Ramlibacter tataouinensis]
MKPLDGVTVVALEHAIAAPFATRQLADLGARVIKVERTGAGDFARGYDTRVKGQSSHFVWANRGKESLALDLKQDAAREALMRLVDRADVVVQNLAPGAAERLGLGWAALSARRPSLILCDISGYGNDGPYRDKKAYDLLIQAESGFLSVTGTPGEVVKAGISIADIAAGMYAYTNVLAALIERGRSGRGRHIDVSMLEAMAEWMGYPLYYAFEGAMPPPRAGASHATIYPYGPFDCGHAIGQPGTVMLGLQNEREWQLFCDRVLGRTELAGDARFNTNSVRSQHRGLLRAEIDAVFAGLTAGQVIERLEAARIANAQVNDMDGLWSHQQLRARRRWSEVATPAGPVAALWPPGQRPGEARMNAVPAVGEHTDLILRELGYADPEISALRASQAV